MKRLMPRIQVALPILETMKEIQAILLTESAETSGRAQKDLLEAAELVAKARSLILVIYKTKA